MEATNFNEFDNVEMKAASMILDFADADIVAVIDFESFSVDVIGRATDDIVGVFSVVDLAILDLLGVICSV
jgi:hypothetical protein